MKFYLNLFVLPLLLLSGCEYCRINAFEPGKYIVTFEDKAAENGMQALGNYHFSYSPQPASVHEVVCVVEKINSPFLADTPSIAAEHKIYLYIEKGEIPFKTDCRKILLICDKYSRSNGIQKGDRIKLLFDQDGAFIDWGMKLKM